MYIHHAHAAIATDARDVRALPEASSGKVLDEAPAAGLRTPLKRAVNERRFEVNHAQEPPRGETVWIQASGPPSSPRPGADRDLARAVLALCREHAAKDPSLTPLAICETLNAVYREVQDHGLVEEQAA